MPCKYCGRKIKGTCTACADKLKALRSHGKIFRSENDPMLDKKITTDDRNLPDDRAPRYSASKPKQRTGELPYKICVSRTGARMGEGVHKLNQYVNQTGSIHYGQTVAERERRKT